jgi:hypothetical protein
MSSSGAPLSVAPLLPVKSFVTASILRLGLFLLVYWSRKSLPSSKQPLIRIQCDLICLKIEWCDIGTFCGFLLVTITCCFDLLFCWEWAYDVVTIRRERLNWSELTTKRENKVHGQQPHCYVGAWSSTPKQYFGFVRDPLARHRKRRGVYLERYHPHGWNRNTTNHRS